MDRGGGEGHLKRCPIGSLHRSARHTHTHTHTNRVLCRFARLTHTLNASLFSTIQTDTSSLFFCTHSNLPGLRPHHTQQPVFVSMQCACCKCPAGTPKHRCRVIQPDAHNPLRFILRMHGPSGKGCDELAPSQDGCDKLSSASLCFDATRDRRDWLERIEGAELKAARMQDQGSGRR